MDKIFYLIIFVLFSFSLHAKPDGVEKDHQSTYRLHVGDKLLISVYAEPNTKKIVTVAPSGKISYLFIEEFLVLGKTIAEVRQELVEKLKTYYRYPLVIITPVEFTSNSYAVMGQVNFPGAQMIRGNPTILTALALAGGFPTRTFRDQVIELADLEHSFLARNGQFIPVDFERLVRQGDLSQDLLLQDGDYIYINTAFTQQVFVLGEVITPLTIEFFKRITLVQAITEAGGRTLRASSRVAVIRGSLANPVKYLIDINRILKGYACDFLLEPGDIVYVPAFKFTSLKELFKAGVSTFVAELSSLAGTRAYVSLNHRAAGNVISPVPVVGFGGTGVTTITPSTVSGVAIGVQ